EGIGESDRDIIYHLLSSHVKYTKSKKAEKIINNMHDELKNFIKVIPIEYKRILEGIKLEEKLDLVEASDG
ncbi:MAG: hypothetical protein NTZ48_04940, partial [Candidatus Omnitrophica bacterium]|nr:hypothetical protein [Candidatus Omnitrophota bacterium]